MGAPRRSRGPGFRAPGILAVIAAFVLTLAFVSAPTGAARPNGAGLVIRHGDGRIVYAYVEFTEPEITGDQLLARSHLPLVTQAYGGLGQAVCSLDGEGCPATNCFCKSYQSPSFYWHYYDLNADETWSNVTLGPSSRKVHDGDVDGWSWTASASGLPTTSIDAIARMNGIDRSAGTSPLAPAATAAPTAVPTATAVPPTPLPPTPTARAGSTVPSAAVPTAVPPTPTVAPTSMPSSPVAEIAVSPAASPSPTARATPPVGTWAGSPVARAVEVDPNGGTRPLTLAARGGATGVPTAAYVAFAVILVALAGLCGWLLLRKRPENGP